MSLTSRASGIRTQQTGKQCHSKPIVQSAHERFNGLWRAAVFWQSARRSGIWKVHVTFLLAGCALKCEMHSAATIHAGRRLGSLDSQ